jgi:hypothetical protein
MLQMGHFGPCPLARIRTLGSNPRFLNEDAFAIDRPVFAMASTPFRLHATTRRLLAELVSPRLFSSVCTRCGCSRCGALPVC